MKQYLITVFTPTYNRAHLLPRLFQSLKQQTAAEFEWIIVDDESSDETETVVKKFLDERTPFPIRYYKQKHGGKHRAVNLGVKEARGSYFYIVDSDDWLPDYAVELLQKWLKEIEQSKNNDTDNEFKFSKVAIVLNDESLVPLVIKSLPVDYKDKVNITMGYPLNQTWLYGEVLEKLNKLADKNEFSQEDVFNVIKEIADNISQGEKHENLWQIAVLKKICNTLLKFIEVIEKIDKQNLSAEIVKNVLKKELSSLNVDIISDGIGGVQLMGMLETRALDFDYILMLSANDDNLPDISKDTSFIPYSFRKAYNMMNADRKAGVFAYYFYRLLHHAKRVDYVYTTVGSENKLKEKSRFIRQIETEFKELKNTDKQIM